MLAVQLLRACEFFPVIACQGFPWFVPFSARCVFFSSRASETFETVSPCRRTKVFTHTTCFFLLLLFCRFPDLISTFLSKIVLKWDFLIVWFGLFVMSYGFLCCCLFFFFFTQVSQQALWAANRVICFRIIRAVPPTSHAPMVRRGSRATCLTVSIQGKQKEACFTPLHAMFPYCKKTVKWKNKLPGNIIMFSIKGLILK